LVPVFMLWLLTAGKKEGKKDFIETLPFALWSGVVLAGSSILTVFLGQEFPSIIGSLLGLGVVLFTIKVGLFIPKSESGFIHKEKTEASLPIRKVLFPYIFLIILLVLGKFFIASKGIVLPILIKHTFGFFNPGFAFIIAGLVVTLLFRVSRKVFSNSLNLSARKSIDPFLVIVFMSSMAQIMVNSAHNTTGFLSMIDVLAVNIKNAFLPFWAPFIGAFGSFLTGSVTISNLMFGNFLATTARDLSFNVESVLALAVVGAAAGNMIALADILVAEVVVGLKHQERAVLKGVMLPCLISVVIVGVVGMLVL
jgi:lactate permease